MTSIGIIGSEGRMGVALSAAISEAGERSCGIDKGGNVAKLAAAADVLVDFSSPGALEATLDVCIAANKLRSAHSFPPRRSCDVAFTGSRRRSTRATTGRP